MQHTMHKHCNKTILLLAEHQTILKPGIMPMLFVLSESWWKTIPTEGSLVEGRTVGVSTSKPHTSELNCQFFLVTVT